MQIKTALLNLDFEDDDLWTDDGLPRVGAVAEQLGRKVTRQEVTDAAPGFTREVAAQMAAEETDEEEADEEELDEEEADEEAPEYGEDHEDSLTEQVSPAAVLKMDPRVVLSSRELTEIAWREANRRAEKAREEMDAAKAEMLTWSNKAELLDRQLQRLTVSDTGKGQREIKEYLKRSQEARAERTMRARRFIEAGTNAKDVSEALSTTSKLDRAMERRRGRGGQRPERAPIRQGGGEV